MNATLRPEILKSVQIYQDFLKNHGIAMPGTHAVLGSGIGSSFVDDWIPKNWEAKGELNFRDLPAISSATAPGHAGIYRFFRERTSGQVLCLQVGRLHGYEGLTPEDATLSVMVPRYAGTSNFVLTNAAGGLKLEWEVGSIMMIRDHVNFTGQNPLVGPMKTGVGGAPIGPRFPDLSKAWDREYTEIVRRELTTAGLDTHDGTYLGVLGPSFETPAEVRLFASWGMGTVGMSTVWEAIALAHSGARLSGFSLISNLGSGLNPGAVLDHFVILETSRIAARKVIQALFAIGAGGK
ncbi:MAG: purine-nucleoside phosphorylase [Bdellovibrionales bacterium]|nr:purine-nucleoside phosphorylase [Bdellovibrionales bacterium]